MSGWLIGIDGGGSKTAALLADTDGRVLGRGVAGASNYQAIGLEPACAQISQAIRAAFADARLELAAPAAICLGLAGAGRPDDQALFRGWAAQQWPGAQIAITSDIELVLAAGTPHGWGLALICGTGSIAFARSSAGRIARAGGWGYLLGDEGSSYAIGLATLRAVARAADGRGPATALTPAILAHWQLQAPYELIRHAYRAERSNAEIAALAEIAERLAAQGDPAARQIIDDACRELALALHAAATQIGSDLREPQACALAGGLIVHRPALARGVANSAAVLGLRLDPLTPVEDPAIGALRIAARLLAG